jgi:hypothetical protein
MVVKSRIVARIKFGVTGQENNPQSATIHSLNPLANKNNIDFFLLVPTACSPQVWLQRRNVCQLEDSAVSENFLRLSFLFSALGHQDFFKKTNKFS